MRKGSVWIDEDETSEVDGTYLLGTFSGLYDTGGSSPRDRFQALTIDEAIAWGRARTDRVYITFGGVRYSVEPAAEHPRWPPDDLPPLVRRRPAWETWRDRTDADAPIHWAVDVWLGLRDGSVPDRERCDRDVVAFTERSGAETWDAEALDQCLADIERAQRGARRGEEVGWSSYGRGAYRVRFVERASTQAGAIARVRRGCVVPDGWSLELEAAPA